MREIRGEKRERRRRREDGEQDSLYGCRTHSRLPVCAGDDEAEFGGGQSSKDWGAEVTWAG